MRGWGANRVKCGDDAEVDGMMFWLERDSSASSESSERFAVPLSEDERIRSGLRETDDAAADAEDEDASSEARGGANMGMAGRVSKLVGSPSRCSS